MPSIHTQCLLCEQFHKGPQGTQPRAHLHRQGLGIQGAPQPDLWMSELQIHFRGLPSLPKRSL
jgi:hypothetical protein